MKNLFAVMMMILLFVACEKEELADPSSNGVANGISQEFLVRIENISASSFPTPISPGVWAVQKKNSTPIFTEGRADYGEGLEAIAEDGDPGMLVSSLRNDSKVRSHAAFTTPVGASAPAPIFPGEAYEFTFVAKPNDFLNFATMFVQSNDLFIAPEDEGIDLFKNGTAIDGDITRYLYLWDAGTEVNEEPGVGPNQAPRQSGPNTGVDENGLVRLVDDGYSYPDVDEVVRVTIQVIN